MRQFMTGAVCVGVALASAFTFATSNAAADIIIDNFTDVAAQNPWPLTVTPAAQNAGGVEFGVGGVLGGVRVSALNLLQFQLPFDNANANIYSGFGLLDFNSTAGAGASLTLGYPGNAGLNANFSTEQGIAITFDEFDLGSGVPTAVRVEISDGAQTAVLTQLLVAAGPQTTIFNFAAFANIGMVNLSSIQNVNVIFNVEGNFGVDFRVTEIRTFIPAPGALTLLGLAGLVASRRRR